MSQSRRRHRHVRPTCQKAFGPSPWTTGSTVRRMASTRPSGQPSRKQSVTSKSNRPGFMTKQVLLPPRTSAGSFDKLGSRTQTSSNTQHVIALLCQENVSKTPLKCEKFSGWIPSFRILHVLRESVWLTPPKNHQTRSSHLHDSGRNEKPNRKGRGHSDKTLQKFCLPVMSLLFHAGPRISFCRTDSVVGLFLTFSGRRCRRAFMTQTERLPTQPPLVGPHSQLFEQQRRLRHNLLLADETYALSGMPTFPPLSPARWGRGAVEEGRWGAGGGGRRD